jgi:transposase
MDHVAIDLGGRESQICARSSSSEIKLEKRVPTKGLKEFFAQIEPSRIIMETCAEAFAVAALAKDAGHDVRIVPGTLVRSIGVGQRGIKTDVRDARCLSEASTRVELASVHIPSKASREMKSACGMREALVASRTKLINNVRGWMRGQLTRIRGGATETFPARLREHCSSNGIELQACVVRQLHAIESLTAEIEAADVELADLARKNDDCRLLMTVPGVGPLTSIRFLAAVDQVTRFRDAHQLESYFGMTPGERSSSDTRHRTSLTKAGSKKVRWLLIQAAWTAYRCRGSDPMVLWAKRIAKKGRLNLAIAALARKMVGIMFAILRDKKSYNPTRASAVRPETTEISIVAGGSDLVRAVALREASQAEVEMPVSDPMPAPAAAESRPSARAAKGRSANRTMATPQERLVTKPKRKTKASGSKRTSRSHR